MTELTTIQVTKKTLEAFTRMKLAYEVRIGKRVSWDTYIQADVLEC